MLIYGSALFRLYLVPCHFDQILHSLPPGCCQVGKKDSDQLLGACHGDSWSSLGTYSLSCLEQDHNEMHLIYIGR